MQKSCSMSFSEHFIIWCHQVTSTESKAPNTAEDCKAIGVSTMPLQSSPQLSLPDRLLLSGTLCFALFAIVQQLQFFLSFTYCCITSYPKT